MASIGRNLLVLLFFFLCAADAIAAPVNYEAWYDTLMTVPGQPPQKGKLHTFFNGKNQWSKQEDGSGNKSGSSFEIPLDTTLADYMQMLKAKSLGKKMIDGKSCDGWSYSDQVMQRPSVNWIDDTGHLYLQQISKYTGTEGTWEQKRTEQKLNPATSDLTTDPACK